MNTSHPIQRPLDLDRVEALSNEIGSLDGLFNGNIAYAVFGCAIPKPGNPPLTVELLKANGSSPEWLVEHYTFHIAQGQHRLAVQLELIIRGAAGAERMTVEEAKMSKLAVFCVDLYMEGESAGFETSAWYLHCYFWI